MTHRSLRLALAPALLSLLAACGGSQSNAEDPNSVEALLKGGPAPSASASAGASQEGGEGTPKWSDKASSKAKDDDLNEAQKTQMEIALRRGGDKAANCGSVVPNSPRGEGEVKVTFDGKKGRATEVQVGPPWAGTDAEGCIKRAFIGEIIVPFEGELEVPYTVKVGGKAEPDKGGKKKK